MADLLPAPQQADDFDGFLQHLQPHVCRRPMVAKDVLIQVLAGADAQLEAAVQEQRRRGGGLGGHDRMDARGRTRHCGRHPEAGRGCDAADHAPHERTLPLLLQPRVEVIGDAHRLHAGVGRQSGLPHELPRIMLL